MPILVALQAADGVWPYYASMILMELYEINTNEPLKHNTRFQSRAKKPAGADKFAVRLIYNGKVLSLPFCSSSQHLGLCNYQTLSDYMNSVTPSDDVAKECDVPSSKQTLWKWQL